MSSTDPWTIPPTGMTDAVGKLIEERDTAQEAFEIAEQSLDELQKRQVELENEGKKAEVAVLELRQALGDAIVSGKKAKLDDLHAATQRLELLNLGLARAKHVQPRRRLSVLRAQCQVLKIAGQVQVAVALAERDVALSAIAEVSRDVGAAEVVLRDSDFDRRRSYGLSLLAKAAALNSEAEFLQAQLRAQEEEKS